MEHPYAQYQDPSYENFKATCPVCHTLNIFNRATDFGDLGLISFRTVNCQSPECNQQFNINCDVASPDYQMFIMQCYELKESKQYMFCILVLAQAFELFFSNYLYMALVLEPVKAISGPQKWKVRKDLEEELYEKTKSLEYKKLRNVFLSLETQGLAPMTPQDASLIIQTIPNRCSDPSNASLDACHDNNMRLLLHSLKNSRTASLRNRVVHKQGYRPRLDEVENALREAQYIIFGLRSCLKSRWQA